MISAGRPLLRRVIAISIVAVAVVSISYFLGAATMWFGLPASRFLGDSFEGAAALYDKYLGTEQPATPPVAALWPADPGVSHTEKTWGGYAVYSVASESRASLIDMKGTEIHVWKKPFSQVWSDPPHVKGPVSDARIYFCGCRVFPEGDLLAVYQATGDTPYGYGLVKLDRNSNVIWKYADNVHHEVDVGEDGKIYALTHRIVKEVPAGLEWIPAPCLVDYLVVLTADGVEIKKVPILEAFRDSEYRLLLDRIRNQQPPRELDRKPPPGAFKDRGLNPKGDILHANYVHVLTNKLAPRFPQFKAGQVMLSFRELSALAVLDIDSGKVVWATTGPWVGQHCAQFVDDGHVLLLDNHGMQGGARAIECDPATGAFPWWIPKLPGFLRSDVRGIVQRLPNGNTFIVESQSGDLREFAPDGDLIWHLATVPFVPSGRRYSLDELPFVREGKGNRQ